MNFEQKPAKPNVEGMFDEAIERDFGEKPLSDLYEAAIKELERLGSVLESYQHNFEDTTVDEVVVQDNTREVLRARIDAMKRLIAKKKAEASE